MALSPGVVVDRYLVERVLGSGGQATVYQVRHRELDVVRALKVLEARDSTARARLFAEGRILARLRHPNLVEVLDVLTVEGSPALLMDFVGGGSLQDRVALGPLPLSEIERLFLGILAGVEAAHAAGVIHRDLKPANVLLDDETPRVADFGIARAEDEDTGLTRTGTGLGSPAWMAPEQARGAKNVDVRADLWGLGAILYALLTGRQPFVGANLIEVLTAVQAARYTPVRSVRREVPEPWAAAVDVCLRADPAARPASVAALRAVFLGKALGTTSSEATWADPGDGLQPEAPGLPGRNRGAEEAGKPSRGVETGESRKHVPEAADVAPGRADPTEGGAETGATPGPREAPKTPEGIRGAEDEAPAVWAGSRGSAGGLVRASGVETRPSPEPNPDPPAEPRSRQPHLDPGVPRPRAWEEGEASTGGPSRRQPGPPLRPGQAFALVVDDAGRGHVVEVLVDLGPGTGEVFTPGDVARDAQVAAQVAVAAALGPLARSRRVTWQVRGAAFQLHGTSIGLALAMAVESARRGRPLPPGWAFTGGVDLDGRIVAVAGVPAKLRAAAEAGIPRVTVPTGSSGGVAFSRLADLRDQLFPPRPPILSWAALLLPALLALLGVFAPLDAWAHYPLLRAADRAVDVEDAVVVRLPDGVDLRAWRPMYPALLTRLADAGARAVLLDVTFGAPTEADEAFAAAIRNLSIPVILPVRLEGETVTPPVPALAATTQVGHAVSLVDLGRGWVRRARLQVHTDRPIWHVSVLGAAALTGSGAPSLTGGTLTVGPLRVAATENSFALAPAGHVPVISWDGPLDAVSGRLAIVGSLRGDADLQRTPDGPRYGAEILAVEVETLLRQAAPRECPPAAGAGFTLLVGVATRVLSGRARIVPLLGGILLILAFAAGGVLLPIGATLLAAAIGWRRG